MLWHEPSQCDLLFVTLNKSETLFSPSTRYRDLALGPSLFHWESQSITTAARATRHGTSNPAAPGSLMRDQASASSDADPPPGLPEIRYATPGTAKALRATWNRQAHHIRCIVRFLPNRCLPSMACFQFGSYTFDEARGLFEGEQEVHLSPLQHRMLQIFCQRAETLLSKEQLMQSVWNHTAVSDVSLSRTVHELRQKLGGGVYAKQLIASVYGRGYVFSPGAA